MKNYRYLAFLFPVLAGCAVSPAYVTPGTPAITLASPQQAQFAPTQTAASNAAWWTFFDDARLSQLIASALEHNLDIAQAQANLLAARAVFDERRLDELPAVTGQAEWGLLRQDGRIVGIHSLSPIRPIKQDNFLDEDASLRRKQRYADWHFTYPHDLVLAPPDAAGGAPGLKPKGAN